MSEEWCIEIGNGEMTDKTCLSTELMLIALLIEMSIYILVGAGIWGYFKRTFLKRSKNEKMKSKHEKNWQPRAENRENGKKG